VNRQVNRHIRRIGDFVIAIGVIALSGATAFAQLRGRDLTDLDAANAGRGRGAPVGKTPKESAPIDLTGYWVSIVSEDWRFRMVTPPPKDYASVPLNAAARAIADKWDPAKDEGDGNACKSYGAANIMRVPGRLRITWDNDTTLKIETDAGQQTRVLHFGPSAGSGQAANVEPSWQGYSVATWEPAGGAAFGGRGGGGGGRGGGGGGGGAGAAPAPPRGGSLKVVTTRLKEGYLRKNGVPVSENATVTEYFDRHSETDGSEWFTVTTIVDDPKFLAQNFITSTHFKKEPDASKFSPSPCKAR
jgi:hypothetical protein